MMEKASSYDGREQALVKHTILRLYLQALALKVGQYQPGTTLNYIDGFSGPWDAVGDGQEDSSPAIAMAELERVRQVLAGSKHGSGKTFNPRAMFVEADPIAHQKLTKLCASARIEAHAYLGEFESHVDVARRFASHGPNPFSFVFLDPKGWTGFGIRRIEPLLRVQPGEVLINFMWAHISRFIDDESSTAHDSFNDLFGEETKSLRARWQHLRGLDREDEVVRTYCGQVGAAGGFSHCTSTIIANPTNDRTHYRLVYGTRSRKGLAAFREIERKVTPIQQVVRAGAKQRKTEATTRQLGLLPASELDSGYFETLVARYRAKAREALEALLRSRRSVEYESTVDVALGWPMTSETELKAWLSEWRSAGRIEVRGLSPKERTPKLGVGHTILWKS